MKKYILILVTVLAFVMFCGCTKTRKNSIVFNGNVVTKEFSESLNNELIGTELDIQDIYIKHNDELIPINVYINKGTEKKIAITAQEDLINDLKISSKKNKITIKGSVTKYYDTESIKIEVSGYKLTDVSLEFASGEIDGSSVDKCFDLDISGKSAIKLKEMNGDELDVDVSGDSLLTLSICTASEIDIDASGASEVNAVMTEASQLEVNFSGFSKGSLYVNAGDVEVDLSGASSLTLIGHASRIDAEESGGSSLFAGEFEVVKADIECSGQSVANINVSTTLMYNLSGASYLSYKGKPEVKGADVSGGSKVEQK